MRTILCFMLQAKKLMSIIKKLSKDGQSVRVVELQCTHIESYKKARQSRFSLEQHNEMQNSDVFETTSLN